MKFIVDNMLGKLAKWLRILGYDTRYFRSSSDNEIIKFADDEDRIVLTRDIKLVENKKIKNSILIKSEILSEQLRQVLQDLNLKIDEQNLFSRCTICNELVDEVNKKDILDLIPEYVCKTQDEFYQCKSCRRIYWKGSHYEKILRDLEIYKKA